MARKSVLHLIDTGGPGGAETIFLDLVTGIDPDRWRSVAAVPEVDWLDAELRERSIAPLLVETRGPFDLSYGRRLAGLVRRERIDLIHAHLLTTSVYGSVVGRLCSVPVVCTFHGQADLSGESYRAIKLRLLNRRTNRIIFVSEALRRNFLDSVSPLDPALTRVVHNGIDTSHFRPGRDDGLRRELGIGGDEILVGAVGNVRPSKDYATFLRAAAALRERSPKYRFVVAGDTRTPLHDEMRALSRELGLEQSVTFLGFRKDADRILRGLDIYLISSAAEGFSLSTVQALATGIPVVATRCGGPEEILVDGVTGVLVPIRDPEAMASAIHDLVQDPGRLARLSAAGRSSVEARFSTAAMVAGYERIYRECLPARRPSPRPSSVRVGIG